MIIVTILFIIGFILISKGADFFINSTVEIGRRTNISELILGATIVSFATTLPELTVSLFASIDNHTTMSLGNAVGSIICNTGLILGMVVLISPFNTDRKTFASKSIILLVSIIALIILGLDGAITKIDGCVLLIILGVYMYTNYKSVLNNTNKNYLYYCLTQQNEMSTIKIVVYFFMGLAMMIVGSRLLVDNGVEIASFIGIPQGIISLTVIALGTSLPELVSSITAVRKKHHEICVGNVLGANILNIISVISISSIPNEIPILSQNIRVDYPFMIILVLILIIPTIIKNKLYRIQGFLMLSTYIAYLAVLYCTYMV
ncbi:MAG: calcium/sodium antiporter [Intestinibacter sp.]|uniref:calcium/sodium antiporter n=1 Tax=Intestinibacter sp. TaxID=1965304 RepID=UPI002A7FD1CC|nr:calcium/sodium antiporter [Intestinibacter sp.]MDY4576225.1 calcium/sodium antiporter [Intestinibacter sp.]